jgi:hypothetical protein
MMNATNIIYQINSIENIMGQLKPFKEKEL